MEYEVPAHKRSQFRAPQGYHALPSDLRRSLPVTSDFYAVSMDGAVVPGVFALSECPFCSQSMVPVFGASPTNGKIHARCFSCEQVYLSAKMRRLLTATDGEPTEEPCACGEPRQLRRKTCGHARCEDRRGDALKAQKRDRVRVDRRRKQFLNRMGAVGGDLHNPCRVCGELVDMAADYSGLTFVHSGEKESLAGDGAIGSFTGFRIGSCEHEYLALGGAYRTGRDGNPVLLAAVSPQDLRKIMTAWAVISKDRADLADK